MRKICLFEDCCLSQRRGVRAGRRWELLGGGIGHELKDVTGGTVENATEAIEGAEMNLLGTTTSQTRDDRRRHTAISRNLANSKLWLAGPDPLSVPLTDDQLETASDHHITHNKTTPF
jgi:hypothetical protein